MRYALILCGFLMLVCATAVADPPYLGVNIAANVNPQGIRLDSVVEGGAAQSAGLLAGDIVTAIDGRGFGTTPAELMEGFRAVLGTYQAGDKVFFSVIRRVIKESLYINGVKIETDDPIAAYRAAFADASAGTKVELRAELAHENLEIPVTLGSRVGLNPPMPASAGKWPADLPKHHDDAHYRKLITELNEAAQSTPSYADLCGRLAKLHESSDRFRSPLVAAIHRDPLLLVTVMDSVTKQMSKGIADPIVAFAEAVRVMFADVDELPSFQLKIGLSPKEHAEQLADLFAAAEKYRAAAFSDLTADEIAFIQRVRHSLTDSFVEHIYLHIDDDAERRADTLALLRIAERVKYADLLKAHSLLLSLMSPIYLDALRHDLSSAYADKLDSKIIETFPTPFGPVIIGGKARNWYAAYHAAAIIDLGGDDFYSNSAGSGSMPVLTYEAGPDGQPVLTKPLGGPFGVVIEFEGNDAYESTNRWEIGSGSLGCGLLIDAQGDDVYTSIQWGQGSGLFGCGTLCDVSGNDRYIGRELCQGAAIFGLGMLIDVQGADSYHGNEFCQGLGGSGAVGLLLDGADDDSYFAKGSRPTNYGDAGIYDAWSQGCGIGFRQFSSGGAGLLIDREGSDRYEAGNFSQGGGYYFGFGMLADLGTSPDHHLGSRYNHGFSAHQAIGAFLEEGGNDRYDTRQAVAQGLAWDECVTVFRDLAGDDTYSGGGGFSQGASAHNSFCLFHDLGGHDRYDYTPGQARAGGNDYHGGTSFSLFLDTGGGKDWYNAKDSRDDFVRSGPLYGFFLDLPFSLPEAVESGRWKLGQAPETLLPTKPE